jgi:hypothetical protein
MCSIPFISGRMRVLAPIKRFICETASSNCQPFTQSRIKSASPGEAGSSVACAGWIDEIPVHRIHAQTFLANGIEVRAAGDEGDVLSMLWASRPPKYPPTPPEPKMMIFMNDPLRKTSL